MCMCVTVVIKIVILGYCSMLVRFRRFSFFFNLTFSYGGTFWLKCANRIESWYMERADSAAGVENGMFAQQMVWQEKWSLPSCPQQLLLFPSRWTLKKTIIWTQTMACSDGSDRFLHYSSGAQLISQRELWQCDMQHRFYFYLIFHLIEYPNALNSREFALVSTPRAYSSLVSLVHKQFIYFEVMLFVFLSQGLFDLVSCDLFSAPFLLKQNLFHPGRFYIPNWIFFFKVLLACTIKLVEYMFIFPAKVGKDKRLGGCTSWVHLPLKAAFSRNIHCYTVSSSLVL